MKVWMCGRWEFFFCSRFLFTTVLFLSLSLHFSTMSDWCSCNDIRSLPIYSHCINKCNECICWCELQFFIIFRSSEINAENECKRENSRRTNEIWALNQRMADCSYCNYCCVAAAAVATAFISMFLLFSIVNNISRSWCCCRRCCIHRYPTITVQYFLVTTCLNSFCLIGFELW